MGSRRWLTPDDPATTAKVCRTFAVPDAPDWLACLSGALLELTYEYNWEAHGSATPQECAETFRLALGEFLSSGSTCMLGAILPYATTDPPPNTLPCDGGTYDRVDYPLLYALLDDAFITDEDTFTTPDLDGAFVMGAGTADMGDTGGASSVTLTTAELPSHSHTTQPHAHATVGVATPDLFGAIPGASMQAIPTSTGLATVVVDASGGGGAHENRPPYVALRYCIVAR